MRNQKKIPLELRTEDLEQYDSAFGDIVFDKYESYSKAIGQLFIAFSRLEASIDICIAELIHDGSHDPGYRILKYLKYKDKCAFLVDELTPRVGFTIISRDKRQKFLDRLDELSKELDSMGEFRNKVAHANWMSLDNDGYARVKTDLSQDGMGIIFKKLKMSPLVISKFTKRCFALARSVERFREDMEFEEQRENYRRHRASQRKTRREGND